MAGTAKIAATTHLISVDLFMEFSLATSAPRDTRLGIGGLSDEKETQHEENSDGIENGFLSFTGFASATGACSNAYRRFRFAHQWLAC